MILDCVIDGTNEPSQQDIGVRGDDMNGERVQRRLAAILAADVAGYSRLMGADEAGTRARFNAHLAELIEPAIARRRGRIVKTTGDALLVEFASVVDAVQCAARTMADAGIAS